MLLSILVLPPSWPVPVVVLLLSGAGYLLTMRLLLPHSRAAARATARPSLG